MKGISEKIWFAVTSETGAEVLPRIGVRADQRQVALIVPFGGAFFLSKHKHGRGGVPLSVHGPIHVSGGDRIIICNRSAP
jgi:hypothetical protein